jgi:WD40 repeat protein
VNLFDRMRSSLSWLEIVPWQVGPCIVSFLSILLNPALSNASSKTPALQVQVGHASIGGGIFSLSPFGNLIASVAPDGSGTIKLWETTNGRVVCTLSPGEKVVGFTSNRIPLLAWSEDGNELLSPDASGGLFRWNLRNCGERIRLNSDGLTYETDAIDVNRRAEGQARKKRNEVIVAMVTLTHDRVLLQSNNGAKEIRPFSSNISGRSNQRRLHIPELRQSRTKHQFVAGNSEDGRYLLLADRSGPTKIIDVDTNSAIDIEGLDDQYHGGQLYAISPRGRWLALKSAIDSTLRLYDLTGKKLAVAAPIKSETPPDLSKVPEIVEAEKIRAGVAGLKFSSDEKSLYVFRDGGMSAFRGEAHIEVRSAASLEVANDIVVNLTGQPFQSGNVILGGRFRTAEKLFIPLGFGDGNQLLSVDIRDNDIVHAIWRMPNAGSISSLAYSDYGWSVQTDSSNSAWTRIALESTRVSLEEQRALFGNEKLPYLTGIDRWETDKLTIKRSNERDTLQPRLSIGAFSVDGQFLVSQSIRPTGALPSLQASMSLLEVATGKILWSRDLGKSGRFGMALASAVAPDGRQVVIWQKNDTANKIDLIILNGKDGTLLSSTTLEVKPSNHKISFSENGTKLYFLDAYHESGSIDITDPSRPIVEWSKHSSYNYPLTFLPRSGRLVLPLLAPHIDLEKDLYHRSVYSGWPHVLRIPVAEVVGNAVADANETVLAVNQGDQVIRLFDIRGNPAKIGELSGPTGAITSIAFSPDARRLIAGDAEGGLWLFDVGRQQLMARMYRFDDGAWVVLDREGRFDTNDIDAIRRLHWVMPDEPFNAYPLELFMRDYFEPRLLGRLLNHGPAKPLPDVSTINRSLPEVRIVGVVPSNTELGRVDVRVAVRATQGRGGRLSGGQDLRLLRGQQMVGSSTLQIPDQARRLAAGQEIEVTFGGIKLPSGSDAVDFSAYAFNADRVKSLTASARYQPTTAIARRTRRAYVISFGLNKHDRADWNLKFAAQDARRSQEVLTRSLKGTGEYDEVIPVALVSDEQQRHASKASMQAVFATLAGKSHDHQKLAEIPGAQRLQAATPDDIVIITFAGHGIDANGEFYLVPQEFDGPRSEDSRALARAISATELSDWLKDVDAGDLSLVIDACHSAAAVDSKQFKPGPMGAKGFGQLAYDKGMRVLAATQADDVALESSRLQQGLLTYVLVTEGMEQGKADTAPKDRRIDIAEWLNYATQRVPVIHQNVQRGLRNLTAGPATWTYRTRGARPLNASPPRLQQPSLFDFRKTARPPLLMNLD